VLANDAQGLLVSPTRPLRLPERFERTADVSQCDRLVLTIPVPLEGRQRLLERLERAGGLLLEQKDVAHPVVGSPGEVEAVLIAEANRLHEELQRAGVRAHEAVHHRQAVQGAGVEVRVFGLLRVRHGPVTAAQRFLGVLIQEAAPEQEEMRFGADIVDVPLRLQQVDSVPQEPLGRRPVAVPELHGPERSERPAPLGDVLLLLRLDQRPLGQLPSMLRITCDRGPGASRQCGDPVHEGAVAVAGTRRAAPAPVCRHRRTSTVSDG
jgi:hypothetical protein